MPRACVVCGGGLELRPWVLRCEGRPHGELGHQFVYELVRMSCCLSCGVGHIVYESHDCFSYDDPWEMCWLYLLDEKGAKSIKSLLGRCARSHEAEECDCEAHEALQANGLPYAQVRSSGAVSRLIEYARVGVDVDVDARVVRWAHLGVAPLARPWG